MRPILRVKPFAHHYSNVGAYFRSARLKSAFTFQDLYLGLSPFEAPAAFSMMPYTELADGVWYPAGGMYSIVETLAGLARESGVELRFRSVVDRIETDAGRTTAVHLADGSRLPADVVLANADLPYVYRHLLPPDTEAERLWRKEYSCSTISFFWGLDRTYEALGPHTLFLTDDYRENFDAFVHGPGLARDPSLYVHAPARLDPSMAPRGRDTVIAIVPVAHLRDGTDQDWAALRDEARAHVLRRLASIGVADLDRHLTFEAVFTPASWATRCNLAKGATQRVVAPAHPAGLVPAVEPPPPVSEPLLHWREHASGDGGPDRDDLGPARRGADPIGDG
ncbi:MAG TPA: FAD-dependent oxidoreductase [Candidatus Dormibacteraeota bacterium]|nr:FAD-dependent oxidoreductase [Candidatus Dormibacteraeota bacterium]